MKKLFLYFSTILFITLTSCDGYNRLLKSNNYELKYEKANQYYQKGNYVKATALFEELIPVFKGTDRAEEIYYYYAYCNYYQSDYALSQYHFKNYYRNFPMGKHAEECLFMNAYCYYLNSPNYKLDQTDTKNAMNELQNFIDQYPQSVRIDSCNKIYDALRGKLEKKERDIIIQYYNLGDYMPDNYKAAITSVNNFIKEYPESNYIDEMLYYSINSYYLLAINSVKNKKLERLNLAMENYLKLLDLYPKSNYLRRAESVYESCKKMKSNLN